MELSSTFQQVLESFQFEKVRYLVIGGYTVIAHGYPSITKNIDLWVECSEGNAGRVRDALASLSVELPPTVVSQLHSPSQSIVLGQTPSPGTNLVPG